MVFTDTVSRWGTRDGFADFNADAVESITNLFCRAIVVTLAANRNTNDSWVALHTGWAVALRTMERDATQSVSAALVSTKDARIQTLSGDASTIRWTIVVSFTFS